MVNGSSEWGHKSPQPARERPFASALRLIRCNLGWGRNRGVPIQCTWLLELLFRGSSVPDRAVGGTFDFCRVVRWEVALTMFPKPRIVISKCIGFDPCRYNGEVVQDKFVRRLEPHVEFICVCPEVEIGLELRAHPYESFPRDPVSN